MKVYVLREVIRDDTILYEEIINIFDSLEAAKSYNDIQPEDWISEANSKENGWWEAHTLIDGYRRNFNISEWKVKTKEAIENQNKLDGMYCVSCHHLVDWHGKRGCNHDHDKSNWLEIGCTCSISNFV